MISKQHFLIGFFLLLTTITYGQIDFRQGYFVSNDGERIDCLIKYRDWLNNPDSFTYKKSENAEERNAVKANIVEFGVLDGKHYERATVKVDVSPTDLDDLGTDRNPTYEERTVFLEKIIIGEASLYKYITTSTRLFYYKVGDESIAPLVYKRYKPKGNKVVENSYYRQQLSTSFNCTSLKSKRFERLNYNEDGLSQLFVDYNNCIGSSIINYAGLRNEIYRDTILWGLELGMRSSQFSTQQLGQTADFPSATGISIGTELEYIFDFDRKKWSIVAELSYYSYSAEDELLISPTSPVTRSHKFEYSAIEAALGGRHSFFLNEHSRFFVNAGLVLPVSSKGEYSLGDSTQEGKSDKVTPYIGGGYAYKKWSLDINYVFSQSVDVGRRENDHSSYALNLGYSFL